MRGIVRPCRSHLGPELHARWQSHLCGLCLTLRDVAGQAERALTGYDVLLLSVLVEAQAGQVATTTAAPCPLRGFSSATVVSSTSDAGRLAAAGALLSAGAGLTDKADDGDLPRRTVPAARRVAARLARTGSAVAAVVGLDPAPVLGAPAAAAQAEADPERTLDSLLAPSGQAVAALFAHTASVAGRLGNVAALARAGDAFGRLVHLLDAVDDRSSDVRSGAFNPLQATGTDDDGARSLADDLVARVQRAVGEVELVDPTLVEVLLGRELERAVDRSLPRRACTHAAVPAQRAGGTGAWAATVAAWTLLVPAVFVGGSFGGGGCGPRRRRRYYGAPPPGYGYPPPGYGRPAYGYRSAGPSCGQLLACNCCANLACNACCCGNSCVNS